MTALLFFHYPTRDGMNKSAVISFCVLPQDSFVLNGFLPVNSRVIQRDEWIFRGYVAKFVPVIVESFFSDKGKPVFSKVVT